MGGDDAMEEKGVGSFIESSGDEGDPIFHSGKIGSLDGSEGKVVPSIGQRGMRG